MADDNTGGAAETETQRELGAVQENAEAGKMTPKGTRKEMQKESILASLAKRSRQKPAPKGNPFEPGNDPLNQNSS